MLERRPLSVVDPAFVLTFGATLAILAAGPLLASRRPPRLLAAVLALFVASAATEALLMPVGAILFSRITFAGLVLNFLAIPLMAVTQVAGMAVVPAAFVARWLSLACGLVAHVGTAGPRLVGGILSGLRPSRRSGLPPPGWPCVAESITWRSLSPGSALAARRVPADPTAAGAAIWMVAPALDAGGLGAAMDDCT